MPLSPSTSPGVCWEQPLSEGPGARRWGDGVRGGQWVGWGGGEMADVKMAGKTTEKSYRGLKKE